MKSLGTETVANKQKTLCHCISLLIQKCFRFAQKHEKGVDALPRNGERAKNNSNPNKLN